MAQVLKRLTGSNTPVVMSFPVAASQTIKIGDVIQITSGKAAVAVAASTSIIGIAVSDITTGGSPAATETVQVELVRNAVVRIDYTGTTKTSLAQTDVLGTVFDLGSKTTLNLDDTTGGMLKVVGFDNSKKTADVVFTTASLAI